MNGDHAADVSKLAELWEKLKMSIVYNDLGRKVLSMHSPEALLEFLFEENQKKIAAVGGITVWEAMQSHEQDTIDELHVQQMLERLGREAHADLPEDVRRAMDFFVRAGCCMHKDLNSVKGGVKAMAAWYQEHNKQPPVLLANRDLDVTIRNMGPSSVPRTTVEQHALDNTSRGGIKAASLAGAIFNNSNEKKGQQDTYRNYFEHEHKLKFNFPDTNNTRYGSHCDGAAELLTYLDTYLAFLRFVKDKKDQRRFNHMESNLYKALQDPPTLSELAVLALYGQCVSKPYMSYVRGSENINVLDLGQFHRQIKEHVAKIADNPNIIISSDPTSATIDGKVWERPESVYAILRMKDSLPYLEDLISAFCRGALVTWERFTSEFAPGGLIDMSTAEERELAWMPTTNDANEGALGSFRVHARWKPRTSMQVYNSHTVFHRNGAQDFMDMHFTAPEDHTWLRKMAREIDTSGVEQQKKMDEIAEDKRKNEAKLEKAVALGIKRAKKLDKINSTARITTKEEIERLSVPLLREQIDVYRMLVPDSTLR